MAKHKTIKMVQEEYDDKYGDLPLNQDELIELLFEKYKKVDKESVYQMANEIDEINWETETYVIPVLPKPCHRPRYSFETRHFYVPGASDNKKLVTNIIGISPNLILARIKLTLVIYQQTPVYKMNKPEVILAEMGKICPVIDPDIDNFAKAYLDAIQGVLIADDNIISDAIFTKRFSIKPRVELKIEYMTKPDSAYTEKVLMSRLNKNDN